ncbi:MAG: FecR domain-containing protein [Rhodospirillaceae bacterium]|nr:FecR domain-containing protein [Rhodospirillaceae bacterium]
MTRARMVASSLVTAGLVAVAATPALAELGDPAGIAGAVQGSVALESPARKTTIDQLASGEDIVMGDAVNTRAKSRLQIMLLDETAITMGENASLVIDEFVYDPAGDNASLAASVKEGAFRLVTGGVARTNPEGTKVTLPNAVLTIRGTTTQGNCDASGCIVALAGTGDQNSAGKKPSQVLIQSAKESKILKRAGFFVFIGPDGSITDPAPLEEDSVEKLTRLFEPVTGGGGADYLGGAELVDASGQPTADGGPLSEDLGDVFDSTDPAQNVGFESTANLPSGQLTYFADDIPLTGGGGFIADYDVNYTLDLASREFNGLISVFATGTPGTFSGTFPLLHNPFELGFEDLHESGLVIDSAVDDSIVVDYSIGPNQIDTAVTYTVDPALGGPYVLSGSGPAPLQP